MTHVIFSGPTMSIEAIKDIHPEALVLPPVRQGDVISAVREYNATAIGIIDGVYLDVLSVWHKEILSALDQGVRVYGAASMGALRAAECDVFGMIGIGRIYQMYKTEELTRDDEVAISHATAEFDYRQLSEPLVNIRLNLAAAVQSGVLSADTADSLINRTARLYFPDRSWPQVLDSPDLAADQHEALRDFVANAAVDYKAQDARLLVTTMANLWHGTDGEHAVSVDDWELQRTHYLAALEQRDQWHLRQGAQLTPDTLSRFILANDPEATSHVRTALLELVATYAGSKLGIEPSSDVIADTRARFRAARGIDSDADLSAYLRRNNLTETEFDTLMTQQARVETVLEWLNLSRFKLGLVQPLLDQYRLNDTYAQWADAAAFTQQVSGTGPDGLPAHRSTLKLSAAEQEARHRRHTGWSSQGLSLEEWSGRYGFLHPDALQQEFDRSMRARHLMMAAGQAAGPMDQTSTSGEG